MERIIDTTQSYVIVVVTTTEYTFPNYPEAKCPAHGQAACVGCARNPGSCGDNNSETAECGYYGSTGMHWDTCPNRVR